MGYKDAPSLLSESSTEPPRAPGMKYKHYSPTARVVLAELHVHWDKVWSKIQHDVKHAGAKPISKIGIIKTKEWPAVSIHNGIESPQPLTPTAMDIEGTDVQVFSLDIGHTTATVARGLFSALRDLDSEGVQVIYVEGISDVAVGYDDGVEMAVAVMNRLRKAATERVMPEHVVSG